MGFAILIDKGIVDPCEADGGDSVIIFLLGVNSHHGDDDVERSCSRDPARDFFFRFGM